MSRTPPNMVMIDRDVLDDARRKLGHGYKCPSANYQWCGDEPDNWSPPCTCTHGKTLEAIKAALGIKD